MENPATWGEAEKIVHQVLNEHDQLKEAVIKGESEPLCGLSLERQITDALRKAGMLDHDQPYETCTWCHP